MKIAIVKYNAGNVQSVIHALNRLGIDPLVTDDEKELRSADKVIFPGVGHAASAMAYLRENGLDKILPTLTQPFLGICIGQQLMCAYSEEGDVECLGIFPLKVKKFHQGDTDGKEVLKVPHMGWNAVTNMNNPLFKGIDPAHAFIYYVHSYYCEMSNEYTVATTHYVHDFSAALHRDNFYAVQFHPEKSGKIGEMLLKNFLSL